MGLYIIIMGVQGAGKGLQAAIIERDYGIPQVSTGDLFRAISSREDEFAQRVKAILNSGALVPDDITCEMVAERLAQPDAANGVILDGFPRNENQADWLKAHLAEKGEQINAVLLMELDLYTAFKRAFGRITDPQSGESYNIFYNTEGIANWEFERSTEGFPPKLVVMLENGNTAKRRADDADALAIVKRIDTYMESTMPLVNYYEAQGLVFRVNADQAIEQVTADLKAVLDKQRT